MRSERWYQKRLSNFFMKHYGHHEEAHDIGYYNNPAPNVWKFEVPYLRTLVVLVCDDEGNVTEHTYKLM